MSGKLNNPISVKSDKVLYDKEHDEYSFQMRPPRRFPWWVFLLLLPFLLMIRCQKDLEVSCQEAETGVPVCYQEVKLDYTDFFIVKSGIWFSSDDISLTQQTDSTGVTVFCDLPCSVFSYVFHSLQKGRLTAVSECYGMVDYPINFHFSRHVTLEMAPRREDLRIRVVDDETGDPLPDAFVLYEYRERGEHRLDSVSVDAGGVATIPGMRFCSKIEMLTGRCYGYHDEVRTDILCRDLLVERDSTNLRLKPIKERFTFFVKNKETKQPIPDAQCTVALTLPGISQKTLTRQVRSSIDGKGIAVFANAPILSTISIKASKVYYKDGYLEDGPEGPWKVEEFIKQDDDIRTVWLEPLPYQQEFVNLDSLTLKPIPGVRNEITITHTDGTKTTVTEISNRNGVFPITAKEDEKVEIVSTKGNEYVSKRTIYPKFKDVQDHRIRMMPEMEELVFRTIYAEDMQTLLSDCSLSVTGSVSGALPPRNSGNGVLTVRMRKVETLSIVASKKGYKTNRTKVHNRDLAYLKVKQSRRDIPLEIDLPPCNGGVQESYSGPSVTVSSFSMGQMKGIGYIDLDFYGFGDYLTVYDGPSASGTTIISRIYLENDWTFPLSFSQGAVTVVVESGDRSSGKYVVRCP